MKRIIYFLLSAASFSLYAAAFDDSCGGPAALLSIVNRPTYAESVCVPPENKLLVESGYQYQQLVKPQGRAHILPFTQLRFGLPAKSEIAVLLPSYIRQLGATSNQQEQSSNNHESSSEQNNPSHSIERSHFHSSPSEIPQPHENNNPHNQPEESSSNSSPTSGFSVSALTFKHQIISNKKWVISGEGIIVFNSGSAAYGNSGTGFIINAIGNYNINEKFSLSGMLGVATQTEPRTEGGKRFQSFNPDLVLTYVFLEKLNFYAEIYGQSKTAPTQKWGFDSDFGALYLISPSVVIDVEVGKKVGGNLSNFLTYVGAGISVLLG